ncbi:hypothetical protein [Vibrio viridaestus]|uniref:Holin n=1 Tax=Vibrio viridaestus TaxID=2487322 RepID=A0A3N9TAD0_9VIBR|nr:hypothetical protein [Vibrio viridaestus]RQW61038.1 hypothetical protein EES38_21555 [Vibrio viridaestus]
MSKVLTTVGKRLKQPSTWKGLSTLAVTAGYVAGEVATGGLLGGVLALIGAVTGLHDTLRDEDKANDGRIAVSN